MTRKQREQRPIEPPGVQTSRMGQLWAGLIVAAVVFGLLLTFVLQNAQGVTVTFLWLTGQLPLGIALLLAAIAGVLVVAIPGTVRIIQLRRLAQGRGSRNKQGPRDGAAPPAA